MSENEAPTPTPEAPPPPPPPTPQPAAGGGGGESQNRTLMIVLAYLGLLALVPLLMEKDDKEVQWHAKHGLVLFGLWIVLSVVLSALAAVPVLGCLSALALPFIFLAALIVHIICIVKGINGERFLIPGISDLANKF